MLLFILDLRRRQNFFPLSEGGWRVRRRNFGPLPLGVGEVCRQFSATPLGHKQKYGHRQFIYGYPHSLYMALVMCLLRLNLPGGLQHQLAVVGRVDRLMGKTRWTISWPYTGDNV